MPFEGDAVTVQKERSRLSAGQGERSGSALRYLQHRAGLTFATARQRAGSKKIATIEGATIDRVVGNHLGQAPVRGLRKIGLTDQLRWHL